jgi:ParB/RepB/Spo0J family partition protein
VAYVPLSRLRGHPDNVRRDLGDLRELVESIRRRGVLQPLRVERRPGRDFLRIIAGHRRAAAAELAGLGRVPCVVVAEAEPDVAITEMLTENLHRAGLSPAEKRDTVRRLIREFGYTQAGIAAAVGVTPRTVSQWLRGRHGAGDRRAHVPRVAPTVLHSVVTRWRETGIGGLDATQTGTLLDELEALLGGWTPGQVRTTTSVNGRVLAQVAELDPDHTRPVRDLAARIGCHPRLVERARAALRSAATRAGAA